MRFLSHKVTHLAGVACCLACGSGPKRRTDQDRWAAGPCEGDLPVAAMSARVLFELATIVACALAAAGRDQRQWRHRPSFVVFWLAGGRVGMTRVI